MTAKQLEDSQQDKSQCPADLALDSVTQEPVATEMMDMNAETVGYNEKIVVEAEKKEGKTLLEPNVNEGNGPMTTKQLEDSLQDKSQCPADLALDSIMEVPVATEMMDMNAEIVGYNENIAVEAEKKEGKTLSEPSVNEGNGPMTVKQLEDSQQDKSQCPADLALDSIMEVPMATEIMDINAEIVGYNEKIVVAGEKIDGNEDERQCDTQVTGKEESDPSCPNNSIMSCENNTGSEADCQETNASTGPVVRSTSNGEADDHNTVLTVNVNVDESCPQNNSQCPANSAPDSIMEVPVATEAMDTTVEDVGYNEKIVVEAEKIDGSEDERQCDTQVTEKGESDPSCPSSIMSCENNTGSEAACNKLNLLPVAAAAMDMTAEDVRYNEKIETEKIDGNEDERQCDTQVTGKEETDPSYPNNYIMSCENNTGSEAKLNLLNLDVDKFTPDLTIVKQEPDCQETNKNLVTNDNASTDPVVRSTSNGEADDHGTVLTRSKKSDALSSLTVYRTNVSDEDDSGGDSGTADSDDDSSSGSSSSSSSSSSDSDDEASDSGNDARYVDLPLGRAYTERKLEGIPLGYVLPAYQPYLFWWPPLGCQHW